MPRELPRPGRAAVEAAFSRTVAAFARIMVTLGSGTHTLIYTAEELDGRHVVVPVTVTVTFEGDRIEGCDLSTPSLAIFHRALTWGLEGSIVKQATLFAMTRQPEAEPGIICGWQVTDGWFQALEAEDIALASVDRAVGPGLLPRRYTAPVLPELRHTL